MFLQQPIGPSLNLFKFESLSVLHSWPLIFALEREHADLPPYRQAIWGECVPFLSFPALDLMRTTPLDYFIRLFFPHYFPIHALWKPATGLQNKNAHSSLWRSCVVSAFETDCWLAICFTHWRLLACEGNWTSLTSLDHTIPGVSWILKQNGQFISLST